MDRHKFMWISIELIPQAFIDEYNLLSKVQNGYVYMQIIKGMYGLPQAGMLAKNFLKERLKEWGQSELTHSPGLCTHKNRLVWLTLVGDGFHIKYVDKDHVENMMSVLRGFYKVEEDWIRLLCCRITLDWHYQDR